MTQGFTNLHDPLMNVHTPGAGVRLSGISGWQLGGVELVLPAVQWCSPVH